MCYASCMDVFGALADEVRRELVLRIASEPCTVTELAASYTISRPAISRHLRVLRETGLVTVQTVGRTRVHQLERTALAPVETLLRQLAAGPRIADHLDALDLEVRRTARERSHATGPVTDDERPRRQEDAG